MNLSNICEILSTIATTVGVLIAIFLPRRRKIEARLCININTNTIKMIIKNVGNATVILDSISYYANKFCIETTEFIHEEFSEINELYIIQAGSAIVIDIEKVSRLWYYRGHAFDVNSNNSDWRISFTIHDFKGKKFKFRTKYTLGLLDNFYDRKN